MKRTLALLSVVVLIGLAGCVGVNTDGTAAAADTPEPHEPQNVTKIADETDGFVDDYGIHRFVDEEAGVVCYTYKDGEGAGQGSGLSCMPLNETDL